MSSIQYGQPLPHDLFDGDGRLLLRAGHVIQTDDLDFRRSRLISQGLYYDDRHSAGSIIERGRIGVHTLYDGMRSPVNLYDDRSVLLLPAGLIVTQKMINQMRRRDVIWLYAGKTPGTGSTPTSSPQHLVTNELNYASKQPSKSADRSPATLQTPVTRQLDRQLLQNNLPDLPRARSDRERMPANTLDLQSLREETASGIEQYHEAIENFHYLATQIIAGKAFNVGIAADMLQGFVDMIQRDASLPLLIKQMNLPDNEYLFHHGINVALVSMAAASQMGFTHHQILDAGIGGLFADVGMLRVEDSIRLAPHALSQEQWIEIHRHPILTLDTLEKISSLSQTSLMAAYQAHERCDRSGYPRGRHRQFIHPIARLVAVADTFVAVTCPRPYRSAQAPFVGIKTLLLEAAAGKLDKRIVRAFIDMMSLFPVASHVRLSDHTIAKVLRASGKHHQHPIVVPLDGDGKETDIELDLSLGTDIKVIAAFHPDEIPETPPPGAMLTRPAHSAQSA